MVSLGDMVVAVIGGSWAGLDGDDTTAAGIAEEDLDDCPSVHNWTERPAPVSAQNPA